MNNTIYLFIDDNRDPIGTWGVNIPHNIPCLLGRTYSESVFYLKKCRELNIDVMIDFDHDLGQKKTGYDIAKWIVENNYPILCFRVHSMNPVGRKNIKDLLNHYGYKEFC